jgi:3',5'-cyclic AMP phosphodiesterase CpdA
MALTVLHVTDVHVYADLERVNDGMRPAASLVTVLEEARAAVPTPDCLLLTGDFTNDDTEESYVNVKAIVRRAYPNTPVFFVPGCAKLQHCSAHCLTGLSLAEPPVHLRFPPDTQEP